MKINVPLERAHRLVAPGPLSIVTAAYRDRFTITPVQWTMPASLSPGVIAISLHLEHYATELVRRSDEFALNFTTRDLLNQVMSMGTVSGRDADKWELTGLRMQDPLSISVPLIEECIAHVECVVVDSAAPGDHAVFFGEIVAAQAEESVFDEHWLLEDMETKPLHHLGKNLFTVLNEPLMPTASPEGEDEDL